MPALSIAASTSLSNICSGASSIFPLYLDITVFTFSFVDSNELGFVSVGSPIPPMGDNPIAVDTASPAVGPKTEVTVPTTLSAAVVLACDAEINTLEAASSRKELLS